ncbi:D-glycero-beta-D-manno-heptose-7-phosphate kinase [Methylosinus sp. Sm6]|uniref:D-glycero-beta-D-manno-heptose-7-phosphate kinase n=1 Tax=Methylosinus sp. Sm6 TaxID=2866948 RepID=UPI00351D31A9
MDIGALLPVGSRIVVLGDLMLDSYIHGSVNRISPEAPVPVLRFVGQDETAGGAANVAFNLSALGADPLLIGIVGVDDTADRLAALMASRGIATELVASPDRPTTIKTRVLASRRQQMLRIDREVNKPIPEEVENRLLERVAAALDEAQAIIISDYAKGCLTDRVLAGVIGMANERGVPVLIDPKRRDFSAYAGATYIKPNLAELAESTGMDCSTDEAVAAAARHLVARTGASILLTRSERGMSLYSVDGREEVALPTAAREVFDVSGAGDTVIATFALALVGAATRHQAMRLANVAAGVVVSKAGTATVGRDELTVELAGRRARSIAPAASILRRQEARELAQRWRAEGFTVGFTNGCFDLLHPGHVAILRGSAAECDRLVVGLNSDASVRRLKGETRPVQSEAARAEVIAAIGVVDVVVVFDEDTPLELITALEPDVLIKGGDYTEDRIVGAELVKAGGGRVVRIDIVSGHSTTNLIARSRQDERQWELTES